MKIRMDFVTNSSSSSFILGVKDKLTKEKVLNMMKVPGDSPLRELAEEFAGIIYSNSSKFKLDEILEDYGCEDISELPDMYKKIIGNDEFVFYEGTVSDEINNVYSILCNMDFHYEDENFIFYKEAGY